MKTARRLTLSLLTVLSVVSAAGCGRSNLAASPAGVAASAGLASITVNGVSRKLGYNVSRYKKVLSKKAHPQHLRHTARLPETVDNRSFCAPIADQGNLGSCTAFSMGKGLREYMQRKNGEALVPVSALWLYYEERVLMGSVDEDSGANMVDGMNVLHDLGNATETTWPYLIGQFKVKAPQAAYDTAAAWKIKEATQLASFDDVKTAIANGQPVVFGFLVYSSFFKIKGDGVMPMPKPEEGIMGGHAVQAVGYDNAKKLLTIRNSWGSSWGDKGYFYMPYDFAADADKSMEWFTAK